ncbi:hypothetical protein DIPPA_10062 [Diplonema papillatum]|nr:hypothetical protein DIPPA_10062 [Diplonema papillatum]
MKFVLLLSLMAVCLGAVSRKQRCGSDTDCVTVKDGKGNGQLLVDGLNLSDKENGETVATVEKRLPSWFGPPRPLVFKYSGMVLDPAIPLAEYGIKLAGEVEVFTKESSEDL